MFNSSSTAFARTTRKIIVILSGLLALGSGCGHDATMYHGGQFTISWLYDVSTDEYLLPVQSFTEKYFDIDFTVSGFILLQYFQATALQLSSDAAMVYTIAWAVAFCMMMAGHLPHISSVAIIHRSGPDSSFFLSAKARPDDHWRTARQLFAGRLYFGLWRPYLFFLCFTCQCATILAIYRLCSHYPSDRLALAACW